MSFAADSSAEGSAKDRGADTPAQDAALLASAYFAIAHTAHMISPGDEATGFFWLPAGLLVSMLLLTSRHQWPALVTGAMLGDAAFGLAHHLPPSSIATRFFVTALQSLAGAWAVERFIGRPFRLTTARGLLWFLFLASALTTLGGAFLGVALLDGVQAVLDLSPALWPRWGSNAMGVLLVAPLMLAWSEPIGASLGLERRWRKLELVALAAGTAASVLTVFGYADGIASPMRILLAAPALWAGLRFGLRGATVVHLALAIPIAFLTGAALHGLEPAAQLRFFVGPGQNLVSLIVVVGLALAVVLQESRSQVAALRQSEALFRVAMHRSPIGAAIVGLDGRWIDVNSALCRIVGYSPEQLLTTNFQAITHPEDLDLDLEQMQRTLAGEIDGYRMEKRYIRGDGSTIWVQLDGVLLRSAEGEALQFLSNVQDITERKAAQRRVLDLNATLESRVAARTRELEAANRELELANRELESFSSSVSHDLRSPLRLIDGFSQMLAREHLDPGNAAALADIARIRGAARRMDELIDSMLKLARQTRGPLQRSRVDLSAIARETLDQLAAGAPSRSVRVSIEPDLIARGSPALLRAVMENLLGNAWKFTAKVSQAEIEVGREERGGEPMFFVRDNGAGFSMQYSKQLFRAFRRLHDETEFAGTGIGLVTVQRIVQRHGGRIDFDSEVGEGACFWFSIPEQAPGA
jgi:PAS domain S-box-containing protein